MLRELLETKRLVVCVGSGGVGKTTVSAALALAAAKQGKKSLVVTIDPARRLANALGLSKLGNEELEVSLEGEHALEGRLFAMMLDHKRTFDVLVDRYSPTEEAASRLKANPWYQQMSVALAGAQDYMAVEKLYEMANDRDYDLIVLDTPPTANALDFLEAPERLTAMLNLRPLQWLQGRATGAGRTSRFLRWGGMSLLKALGRVTGREVIDEIVNLLQDLSSLYDGFRERAEETWGLLRSPECGFFLVTVPSRLPVLEALFFHQKLMEAQMPFSGFWLNRVKGFFRDKEGFEPLPQALGDVTAKGNLQAIAARLSEGVATEEACLALLEELAPYCQTEWQELEQAREEVVFLNKQVEELPFVGLIPAIQEDIHDLQGLMQISRLLLADGVQDRERRTPA